MNICLIFTTASVLLLQGVAFAQETSLNQPSEFNSPCPNFPMPVIKPFVDENKLPIIKPNDSVDYKMIIIDPCVSPSEQKSNFLFPVAPQTPNSTSLQFPVMPPSRNGSKITVTPKE